MMSTSPAEGHTSSLVGKSSRANLKATPSHI